MVGEELEDVPILDEAFLEPGAILGAQSIERLLDGGSVRLAHGSRLTGGRPLPGASPVNGSRRSPPGVRRTARPRSGPEPIGTYERLLVEVVGLGKTRMATSAISSGLLESKT